MISLPATHGSSMFPPSFCQGCAEMIKLCGWQERRSIDCSSDRVPSGLIGLERADVVSRSRLMAALFAVRCRAKYTLASKSTPVVEDGMSRCRCGRRGMSTRHEATSAVIQCLLVHRPEGGQPDQADTRPRRSLTWWQLLPNIGPSLLIAQQARPAACIYER